MHNTQGRRNLAVRDDLKILDAEISETLAFMAPMHWLQRGQMLTLHQLYRFSAAVTLGQPMQLSFENSEWHPIPAAPFGWHLPSWKSLFNSEGQTCMQKQTANASQSIRHSRCSAEALQPTADDDKDLQEVSWHSFLPKKQIFHSSPQSCAIASVSWRVLVYTWLGCGSPLLQQLLSVSAPCTQSPLSGLSRENHIYNVEWHVIFSCGVTGL